MRGSAARMNSRVVGCLFGCLTCRQLQTRCGGYAHEVVAESHLKCCYWWPNSVLFLKLLPLKLLVGVVCVALHEVPSRPPSTSRHTDGQKGRAPRATGARTVLACIPNLR